MSIENFQREFTIKKHVFSNKTIQYKKSSNLRAERSKSKAILQSKKSLQSKNFKGFIKLYVNYFILSLLYKNLQYRQ